MLIAGSSLALVPGRDLDEGSTECCSVCVCFFAEFFSVCACLSFSVCVCVTVCLFLNLCAFFFICV